MNAQASDIGVYALAPGVWVDQSVGRIGGRLAQLIVPQQPVDRTSGADLGDFQSSITQPMILREIVIEGNQRLTEGRILEFFDLNIGESVDSSTINSSLRRLYRSGLFQDFRADISDEGILSIIVVERPVIHRIVFEGNSALKDEILEASISSQPRRAYSVSKIGDDVRKIQATYRQSGRFAAVIKPVIIKRPQNRVDIVFEITEGDKTLVESINFVGNSFATDGELRGEMFTKTNNLFSIIFGGDTYDPNKLAFDAENIRNFYLRHGYADFRVLSTSGELDADQRGFNITITMDEGKPFNFGKISVVSDIPELDVEMLTLAVPFESEDRFNNTLVHTALVDIENAAQDMGVPFVRAIPQVQKNSDAQTIDITFIVQPGPKRYIETININGNVRTLGKVIRRELSIAEGDPSSFEKIEQSESQLMNLGFFKTVEITQRQGTNANDVVLDVHIEEKSTGSISAGIGLSTSTGAFATFGISEKNFLGRGQKLSATVAVGTKTRNYDITFVEPRFLERDLRAGFSVFKVSDGGSSKRLYNFDRVGAGVTFGQELFPNWYHNTGLRVSQNEISNVKATASLVVQNQTGKITKTTVSQGLFYDTRNSTTKPTKGYRVGGNVALTGVAGNYKMLQTELSANWYIPITDDITLNVNGFAGRVTPLAGTDVRIVDNYFAGGETDIRGFSTNGIGPRVRSTSESLGGREKVRGSVNLRIPSGLPKHVGVNLVAFSDFGFVRNHGLSGITGIAIDETNSLRTSLGLGIEFDSQVPISILFARPLKKESWDKTESLVISLGTNF
ncbi:MAG: outer membrane protein assembly factor BamA [Alphaproteobacteria bacterium]|nr:outer membrane protein assembly factor BamA [Alphaproteobacteria bacterium]